jgi:shikimate kinase
MEKPEVLIETRRPWRAPEALFVLGPGGVGKSTLGRELAASLCWPLVDLDLVFCEQLAVIGDFIITHGYARYRAENLALAARLLATTAGPQVFVTSSGFLVAPVGTPDHAQSRQLVGTGYGITLLPSLDIEQATEIVVARQLTRGFGFEREGETRKFRERFAIYCQEGDMLVASVAPPKVIANAVLAELQLETSEPITSMDQSGA